MQFTITDCAKLTGMSRTTLYKKYINPGVISVIRENKNVFIELSELVRVFPNIKINETSNFTNVNQEDRSILTKVNTEKTDMLTRENELLHIQLRQAQERELWLKSQIDELRQQQGKLLEDKTIKTRKRILGIF